jgi:hypothetical protein
VLSGVLDKFVAKGGQRHEAFGFGIDDAPGHSGIAFFQDRGSAVGKRLFHAGAMNGQPATSESFCRNTLSGAPSRIECPRHMASWPWRWIVGEHRCKILFFAGVMEFFRSDGISWGQSIWIGTVD